MAHASDKPKDYVISTGMNYSVRDLINLSCKILKINIKWEGKGESEKGYDDKGQCIVSVS